MISESTAGPAGVIVDDLDEVEQRLIVPIAPDPSLAGTDINTDPLAA